MVTGRSGSWNGSWVSRMSDIQALFRELDAAGVEYCVMRTWKDMASNKDIDILLARKDQGAFAAVVQDLGWERSSGENHTYGFVTEEGPSLDIHVGGFDYNNI